MSINPSTIIPDVQATSHNEDRYRPGTEPVAHSAIARFVEQLGRYGAVHVAAPRVADDVLGGRYPVEGERPG